MVTRQDTNPTLTLYTRSTWKVLPVSATRSDSIGHAVGIYLLLFSPYESHPVLRLHHQPNYKQTTFFCHFFPCQCLRLSTTAQPLSSKPPPTFLLSLPRVTLPSFSVLHFLCHPTPFSPGSSHLTNILDQLKYKLCRVVCSKESSPDTRALRNIIAVV